MLILAYLKSQYKDKVEAEFSLNYETRKDSREFLEQISSKTEDDAKKCPDFHFMWKAYQVIQKNEIIRKNDVDFLQKMLQQDAVRFIWYEVPQNEDENTLFVRINAGKIPLTSAELIKAEFLHGIQETDGEQLESLSRLELAHQWDEMEYALQEEGFWGFLTDGSSRPTRIELLFEILLEGHSKHFTEDPYCLFLSFRDYVKDQDLTKVFHEVKKIFATLRHWYQDHEFYHLIGYLVSCGPSIKDIYTESASLPSKSEMKQSLYQKIRSMISWGGHREDLKEYLSGLEFHNKKDELRKILLLFNIALMLKDSAYIRYPFDKHKKKARNGTWSISTRRIRIKYTAN